MQLTLPIKPHDNQLPIIHPKARFNVIAAGRRYGKTESQKLRAIYMVLEGHTIWWVNPTFDNTTETWRDFVTFFEPVAIDINRSRREIILPNGGGVRMIGANNFKRGSGIHHVFIDEAAFCDLGELWEYQLRPMLLDNPDTGATFLSSTNGRNMFWQLYRRGLDPQEPDWASYHFTSYDNPRINPAELDDIKRHTPQRIFDQEYMAEFLDDGGAVFRNLKSCVYAQPQPFSGECVMGVDWGKMYDYTVLTLIDRTTHDVLQIDRFNQIDWTLQRGRLVTLFNKWRPSVIWAERNSIGDPNIEELQKEDLPVRPFDTLSSTKPGLINALALAFEQNAIGIPDDPALLGELQSYTVEKLPGGTYRYNAPAGLHDDMVVSLALAWHGCLGAGNAGIWF